MMFLLQKIRPMEMPAVQLSPAEVRLMIGSTPEVEREIREDWQAAASNGHRYTCVDRRPVTFTDLELTIVDEQHRFGVERHRPAVKGTITPAGRSHSIPRSLALTLYGDLDLSVIDEAAQTGSPLVLVLNPKASGHSLVRQIDQDARLLLFIH
jgi:hypothetical protein